MQNRELSDRQFIHVIKASAGSGKTHRLTGEYLRLLYSKPNNYRHILAVTFTNKATEEMKSRIVQELYNLMQGNKSDYIEQLSEEFRMNEKEIRALAREILESILHDYSSFSISTIDRFFQQTMRAFTREIGITGGYNVEVDDTAYLPEVVDTMIYELDDTEKKDLSKWILDFMISKIQEGKKWSIKEEILKLGKEIFKEKYKSLSNTDKETIQNKEHLTKYRETLQNVIKEFERTLREIGKKGVEIMNKHGLTYSHFKGSTKKSPFKHFVVWANGEVKIPTATFEKLPDNIDEWATKSIDQATLSAIQSAYDNGLNDAVKKAISHFENYIFYNSANTILTYFYTLGILNDIQQRLQQIQQEQNILFLSDTTELLNKIIADSDLPFIYEKTGTRYTNYMIDEFQDTSAMQWTNFRPLIRESHDNNNLNLVVGDVKQSIYRWRNSDWRLLEDEIWNDLGKENIRPHVLETNWRSDANVILFNNTIFSVSSQLLQTEYNQSLNSIPDGEFKENISKKITDVYAQVQQFVPKKKADSSGKVDITFLDNSEKDWMSQALERLPRKIEELQDAGFKLKDIAILVRRNTEAVEIAEYLLAYQEDNPDSKYKYDIISNEALVIANAQSIKAIIAILRWATNQNDRTVKTLAVYEFYRFHSDISPDEALKSFLDGDSEPEFPDGMEAHLHDLLRLPLYELVESFFALSEEKINEKESAYVQAFLDIVLNFSTQRTSNIADFLSWWDEKGYKKNLFLPDDQDAIRILTIHKSKGLGFGVVIMPFAEWDIDHDYRKNNIIWCRPNIAPFNDVSIFPIKYKTDLVDTIFREDYLEEKLFTYIDNINLLYVAFTRAKHQISVFTPKPTKKTETLTTISDLLWMSVSRSKQIIGDANEYQIDLEDYLQVEENEAFFSIGQTDNIDKKENESAENEFTSKKWQSTPFDNRLKLRFKSIGYFNESGKRDYGTLMHELISQVETIADIENAVNSKVISGELSESYRQQTIDELKQSLTLNDEIKNWYSGKYTILNEVMILHPKYSFSRPDRVMIGDNEVIVVDYKFGELQEEKYKRQVAHYMQHIREMGYKNVSGYLFYVKLGVLDKI